MLQNSSPLLESAALCFISTTYFLIIPYFFPTRPLMFCRRRFSQVGASLPLTQKMSSARLKKCQDSNFCGDLVGNKTPNESGDIKIVSALSFRFDALLPDHRFIYFFCGGILLFYWGHGSSAYAPGLRLQVDAV